jgi:succinate dehydrogenase / fumarate reductase membrane anchor subunit
MTSAASLGLRAWLIQRFTAVYMAVFLLFMVVRFLLSPLHSYEEWILWVGNPYINAALAVFIVSLLLHAWVGLRDVVMDYVKPVGWRIAAFAALIIGLGGCAMWSLRLLLKVAGQ